MAGGIICSRCQQRIVANVYRLNGKTYCGNCYDQLMQELTAQSIAKEELINYIKLLFGKSECPNEVIYAIDQAVKQGKKIKGIKATLYYYYELTGHNIDNIYYIGKVITEQYDNARNYIQKQKEINEANKNVDLDVPPIHVTIKKGGPKRIVNINYKMEDL